MLIKLVHLNGVYNPEIGKHVSPYHADNDYYDTLADLTEQAVANGHSVLYMQNAGLRQRWDEDLAAQALDVDPFWQRVRHISGIAVASEASDRAAVRQFEADVLQNSGALVLGAYTHDCVEVEANNLHSRHPSRYPGVDYDLSIPRSGTEGDALLHVPLSFADVAAYPSYREVVELPEGPIMFPLAADCSQLPEATGGSGVPLDQPSLHSPDSQATGGQYKYDGKKILFWYT